MSKKMILNTLLISSALLGTAAAHAATSPIKSESKLVVVDNKKAKLYTNSKLNKSKTTKVGTVYKVDGYRDINSKKYYRVYQEDSKGKVVYKGYILDKDTKVVKGEKPAKKDRLVTLTKDDQTAWKSLYFNKKIKTYDGTKHSSNFEVKYSYNLGNKKYFSLYRGEKWMGYMDESAFKVLTPKAISEDKQDYKVVKDYETYNDIYFTEKGQLKVDDEVKVKNIYTFGTGREYGSIYNKDGKWLGYANMKALKAVEASTPEEPDTPVKPEEPETKPDTPEKPEKPETKPDNPGDKPTNPDKPETPEQKLDKEIAKVKETAKKVYLTKAQEDKLNEVLTKIEKVTSKEEANFKKAQEVLAKAEKDLAAQPNETDGKALDKALKEYADFDKVKDQLTGFDTVKAAKEDADKVMAELKKDAANENKATVELTGVQVRTATKALVDAFSNVKIKTDTLTKAIADAKKAIEGKTISPEDKAKVDEAIQKAEEAVKNNTLSEKNLKNILDSEKAMQEIINKAKDIAEGKDLVALKDAVTKVSEIEKHPEVKDMISVKYNDFTAIKKDFADAKAIVEGKKTTTKAEADKLAKDLINEAKGLKLKKGTLINNMNYAKDMLKNKDQYLTSTVATVEKEIQDAENALANNTLENYTNFQQAKKEVLEAPSQLKKNATTNIEGLKKVVEEVKQLDTIRKDISSKGDKVKDAYATAEKLVNEDQKQLKDTPATAVSSAQKALENAASGLALNNTRLTQALNHVKSDAQSHYLSKAQEDEAKQKLTPIVEAGKKATTVKEYDAYKKAVDALEKTDKDIKSTPTQANVSAIVNEYEAMKKNCASWKGNESKHNDVFTKDTETPFVDALKAVEKVGKAAEAKDNITEADLTEAEKAAQAASGLKFNVDLINKDVNTPATELVTAAKNLGEDYAKTTTVQGQVTGALGKAENALKTVNAISNDKWNKKAWNAIESAEKEVVKDAKFLQGKLQAPLQKAIEDNKGKLENATADSKAALQTAIDNAEKDLKANNYSKFKEDKQAITTAAKNIQTNATAKVSTLTDTIGKVDKIKDVPADDFAKSSYTNLKETYAKAQAIVSAPENYTEKEADTTNTNLIKYAKAIKLDTKKIEKEGKQFQDMVGASGEGGTYYIDNTQKGQLKSAASTIKSTYSAGTSASTIEQFDKFDKADKELTGAIAKVKADCPEMSQVREVRSWVKKLKDAGITETTAKQHQDFFEKSTVTALQNDLKEVQKVADAAPSKSPITKTDLGKALDTKNAIEALTINVTGIEKLNAEAEQYAQDALHNSGSVSADNKEVYINSADAVMNAVEAVKQKLSTNDIDIVKQESSGLKWNTEGITALTSAEKTVKDKVKFLSQKIKNAGLSSTVTPGGLLSSQWSDVIQTVDASKVITTEKSVLEDPAKLSRMVVTSSKADAKAKELGKTVAAATEVNANAAGNKEKSIASLENNLAWTDFGGSGTRGTYYDAFKDLQRYARDTESVKDDKLTKDNEALTEDMKGLRVDITELKEEVEAAKKVNPDDKTVKDAEVITNSKTDSRRELDNWTHINELMKKLKDSIHKVVKK